MRFAKDSPYGRVVVFDEGAHRFLVSGDDSADLQSARSLVDPSHVVVRYVRSAALGLLYAPRTSRVLMVGLGGGSFATLLRRHFPGIVIDAVEINPVVVEAAIHSFDLVPDDALRIHVADGAAFLASSQDRWDFVFLDAFGATGEIPPPLATRQFFEAARDHTAPDGIVVLNLARNTQFERGIEARFRQVFTAVHCASGPAADNWVLFGRPQGALPPPAGLVTAARELHARAPLSFDLVLEAQRLGERCVE